VLHALFKRKSAILAGSGWYLNLLGSSKGFSYRFMPWRECCGNPP